MCSKKKQKNPEISTPYILNRESIYNEQVSFINNLKIKLENTEYKDKLNIITNELDFIRTFSTTGVQGIVGFVNHKYLLEPFIFKLSTDVNYVINHEYNILSKLNYVRKFCPHIVRSIGMIDLPVSNYFIENRHKYTLFHDKQTLPKKIMFMEFVNKLPLYKLCNDIIKVNHNIMLSQILQLLLGLQIMQNKESLTHYDLHTGNILVQMCEPNSIFIYKIEENYYYTPTFGFFPLIIDMGFSYSRSVENNKLMTTLENTDKGSHPTFFDNLYDIHRFLIHLLFYMKGDSYITRHLLYHIYKLFYNQPVFNESGWKDMPHDIMNEVLKKIKYDCRMYKKYDIFYNYQINFLEITQALITLPFKKYIYEKNEKGNYELNTNFSPYFENFMEEYHKLVNYEDFDEHDVLYLLQEMVNTINNTNNLKDFKQKFIDNIKKVFCINLSIEEVGINLYNINYEKLYYNLIKVGHCIENNYYLLVKNHKNIINKYNKKLLLESPLQIYNYISRNFTPYFNINNDTIIYLWDADKECNQKYRCKNLSNNDIEEFNKLFFNKKAIYLINKLNINTP